MPTEQTHTNHVPANAPPQDGLVPNTDKSESNFYIHPTNKNAHFRSTYTHAIQRVDLGSRQSGIISRLMSRKSPDYNGSSISRTPLTGPSDSAIANSDAHVPQRRNSPKSHPGYYRPSKQEEQPSPYRDSLSDSDGDEVNTNGCQTIEARDLFVTTNVQPRNDLPHIDDTEEVEKAKDEPVSWSSLPHKDQLIVLMLARLSEPLTQTSLGSYLFYQLQSFDPSLPDSTVSSQAGLISAAFPFAQFLTAMLWGRYADSESGGRKKVIYIGLIGTMLSAVGFGFSNSFYMAMCFRLLGGILNGNIGVMRTMISEIIKEKKYQSRAFLIMPMMFNIGVIIGPILGESSTAFSITLCADNYRWRACRSFEIIPSCIRPWLISRRKGRRRLDEAMAICTTESHECILPTPLCIGRTTLPRRNM